MLDLLNFILETLCLYLNSSFCNDSGLEAEWLTNYSGDILKLKDIKKLELQLLCPLFQYLNA